VKGIVHQVETATLRRRFITTRKGYFGFAPENCEEGDLVVVLAGGNVPYLIRPIALERRFSKICRNLAKGSRDELREARLLARRCYTILGNSYFHRIMDGEVFELLRETERQLKEILLIYTRADIIKMRKGGRHW
jgi:hypothetical protein